MENGNAKKTISTILKVIPLAMSAAVIVLSTMKQISVDVGIVMLAIGMFCGALGSLEKKD